MVQGLILCPKGDDEDEVEERQCLPETKEVGDASECGGLVPFLRITVGGRT